MKQTGADIRTKDNVSGSDLELSPQLEAYICEDTFLPPLPLSNDTALDRYIEMFETAMAEQKLNELTEHMENMIKKQNNRYDYSGIQSRYPYNSFKL